MQGYGPIVSATTPMEVWCTWILDSCSRITSRRCPYPHKYRGPRLSLQGRKVSVHNVHTLPCGLARTSVGLGRIGYVFGGVADSRGLECNSSPTSGTYFSSSGAGWPLSVDNLFTDGSLRGPFLFRGACLLRVLAGSVVLLVHGG